MPRIALVCEYDGTEFVGYQIQNNGRSVQEELNKAISTLYKEDIKVTGCSRTDAGVHARYHVSSCDVPFYIPEEKIPLALNPFLPEDLSVKKAIYMCDDFSARFDTLGKKYIYRIYSSPVRQPMKSRYAYHVTYKLDVDKMKVAAAYFAGEHDFAAFCAAGGSQLTTVRRIHHVIVRENDDLVEIEVSGEAFLYNMVRIIAGTLMYVGLGKIKPEDIPDVIKSCERKRAGQTLPPQGLTLEEVYYDWESKCHR
ncbi:MAG: tRNA pseudouridine(38-40) synthase TruA [Saccharofermentans sp.]|nr:tRNA pseudouridine(38-40) synthase TruA [Saccharofermentans sp.]